MTLGPYQSGLDRCADLSASTVPAIMAGHAHRRGAGVLAHRIASSAGGDNPQPFRRYRRRISRFCRPAPYVGVDNPLAAVVFSFTLLGGVESLLSAKVADGITGRKHRYNMELVAQGVANVVSACFGGISVTGTIARTATNIRAGAQSPLAGILHAAFLLVFILVAAPLAGYIPLAALAGVLVVVSWNMAEPHEFCSLLRQWRSASILLATFLLTLVYDLSIGIVAGCAMASLFAGLAAKFPVRSSAVTNKDPVS